MPKQRESERQEEIIAQQQRLAIYRRNLTYLLAHAAKYSGEKQARIHAINKILLNREYIRDIKATLRRWGVHVGDLPDDEPPAFTATAPAPRVDQMLPSPPDSKPDRAPLSRPNDLEPGDGPRYDVFISYHDADEEWVSGELLPVLENAGLRVVIGYRDFEIGVPRLVNIERAVENSRHTLIVLTPDWVAGQWEDFQALLASSADPKGTRQKLLPLMYKPCKPPGRIALLEPADLTKPKLRAMQLDKLVKMLSNRPS